MLHSSPDPETNEKVYIFIIYILKGGIQREEEVLVIQSVER